MSNPLTGDAATRFRFDDFVLDLPDRQLWRGDTRIELNARYLDALTMLVRERGRLVDKDRLFEVVWSDVVVSDGALAQCIKEIRRQLGDDAANPRYIQTVPRHGYRFIGVVEELPAAENPTRSTEISTGLGRHDVRDRHREWPAWQPALWEWGIGTLGGGVAGVFGGLLYGYGLGKADPALGTLSTLLVLITVNVLVGLAGGFGVSLGLAAAGLMTRIGSSMRVALRVVGAGLGGLLVGAMANLLGVDAFNLLFGRAPEGITGGAEGAVLGLALALGAHVGIRVGERQGTARRWHAAAGAGLLGGVAGAVIPILGGRLMGGSLDLLARSFADSRLQLDGFGTMFGEVHFGIATQVVLGSIEGCVFAGVVVAFLTLFARRQTDQTGTWSP